MAESIKKLRILALHGYRQNDSVFHSKIGSLRKSFKQKVVFIFAQAPHVVPPLEQNNDNEDYDDDKTKNADARGWWYNTEDKKFIAIEPSNLSVGFEESLALIGKIFETDGPFDGVLGFSQGASFVSILCAIQQAKQSGSIKFNFAIMISGFKSLCQPHAKFYNEKINLPTLHIYGSTDRIIHTEISKQLADLFIDSKTIVHDGGHFVPSKKLYYNDFFQEMHRLKFPILTDET